MKLQTLELRSIASPTSIVGKPNEDKQTREARMKSLWAMPENATIYQVGKLLAITVNGQTLAERLVKGEEFEMESLQTVNGAVLPLAPGFRLSLKTLAVWGCPACRSAHGSGVYPSQEVSVDRLMTNRFFYNPKTRALFTISATCWSDYVKGLGMTAKFVAVPDPKPATALKPAKA